VVAAFEKERAKYRFQYVGDLHGTPVHLHQDPPTSAEPVAWRLRKESGAWMYANTEAFLIINGCPPPEPLYAHPPTSAEPVAWLDFVNAVERLAWSMPAPNVYTPQLMQLCIGMRSLIAHPPTSIEPDVMRLVDAYVLLHVDALDDHPIVLEARAAIIAALKTR